MIRGNPTAGWILNQTHSTLRRLLKCNWRMHAVTGWWKSSGENRRITKKKIQKTPTILRLRSSTTEGNPLPKTVKLGGNPLHTEPVLQLTRKVKRIQKRHWNHCLQISPNTSHYMEAVFSMVRKIYERQPGDPVKDLNVNLAVWRKFMNTTLRAAVHLGKDLAQAILAQAQDLGFALMVACPLVVNGVEPVSSRFWWCRACLEPVALMAYGKNGATFWLAGAVRTLQKRVEWWGHARRICTCRGAHLASTSRVHRTRAWHEVHFTRTLGVCRTSSCCGIHFYRSCSVCRKSSYGEIHRCRDSGKLRCASAYSVCCTALVVEYTAPAVLAAKAPVVEYIAPALAPAPVVVYAVWKYQFAEWRLWCSLNIADIRHDETCFWFAESRRHVAQEKQTNWSRALNHVRWDIMWDVCTNTSTTGQRKNKQPETTRASWKQRIERMSQNLTTLLDLCNNVSRGTCIKEKTWPRRGGTPNTASQRRNTKQHDKGKDGSNTPWNIDSKYQRIRELMKSSHPEDTTLLRVSRLHSGTLWQTSNQLCMVGQSVQNSTCHVKDYETWDSAEFIKDTCRDQQGRKVTNWRSKVIVGIPENNVPNSEWSKQLTTVQNWEVTRDYTLHNHTPPRVDWVTQVATRKQG